MSVNIVSSKFTTEAVIAPPPEAGGRLVCLGRRVLRRLGLMAAAPRGLNLFQMDMAAYRFETDDGRVSVVTLPSKQVDDPTFDAEAEARRLAIPELEKLGGWNA